MYTSQLIHINTFCYSPYFVFMMDEGVFVAELRQIDVSLWQYDSTLLHHFGRDAAI